MILDNCDIGRQAKVRRAILDKNVSVPDDAEIGYDLERDSIHHHVSETGMVVVGGIRTPVKISDSFFSVALVLTQRHGDTEEYTVLPLCVSVPLCQT